MFKLQHPSPPLPVIKVLYLLSCKLLQHSAGKMLPHMQQILAKTRAGLLLVYVTCQHLYRCEQSVSCPRDCSYLCTWRLQDLYALRGSPACPASLFHRDDPLHQYHFHEIACFHFLISGIFSPDLRSQIVRKVLSFCLQVTDRSLTLNIQQNNSSIVGSYSVWYGEFLLYLKVSSLFPMLNILFES